MVFMLKSALKKLVGSPTEIHSYSTLRLQAKTYRLVKNFLQPILKKNKLTSLDWCLLGLLFQNPDGLRFIEISHQMGVEPPFITELAVNIKKKGYIDIVDHPDDRRAKIVLLSAKGKQLIESLEPELKNRLDELKIGISSRENETYFNVMIRLIENIAEQK
ncbi:hypothetical protein COV58_01905 [Candidatus Roizmanbacteria bacterium CG11_big_fil_rev_8_21_14_0_20_36_8]|uniref:HTH marR-type domain-containing protein n=1 Tax=Candidatus Roizmanbacteria bacterium CG11_big_fil_rev_8_21_14_0_20_36_8 TaxID=1974856 RepID=A0A2M6IUL6_9BACT|nr:MAG: hypothetical protein COV58_01905 [Candidatus Roizmanbacteria bacterium CG11_big_fil_rev_8_21_14_0_20_36_8]